MNLAGDKVCFLIVSIFIILIFFGFFGCFFWVQVFGFRFSRERYYRQNYIVFVEGRLRGKFFFVFSFFFWRGWRWLVGLFWGQFYLGVQEGLVWGLGVEQKQERVEVRGYRIRSRVRGRSFLEVIFLLSIQGVFLFYES